MAGGTLVSVKRSTDMIGADRVALVGWLWFVFWIVGGNLIGSWFDMSGTGMVGGISYSLCSLFCLALGHAGIAGQLDV